MYFPTICVDNFFRDPLKIREYALSLEYKSCAERNTGTTWPGKRTETLFDINEDLYHNIVKKIFACFGYRPSDIPLVNLKCGFHKMSLKDVTCKIKTGWVHRDECPLAGLVYLTPNIDPNCGTSIYRLKPNDFYEVMPYRLGDAFQRNYTNYKEEELSEYLKAQEEHNSHFEETINFKNIFNRMIAYDGNEFHGIHNMHQDDDTERLTLVFFLNQIGSWECPLTMNNTL